MFKLFPQKSINIQTESEWNDFVHKFIAEKSKLSLELKFEQVDNLINSNQPDKALNILLKLKREFEKGLSFDDIENYDALSFEDSVEFCMYCEYMKSNNNLKYTTYTNPSYYKLYYKLAYVYVELKQYDKAKEAIRVALKWNPISSKALIEYAEILKKENSFNDEYLTTINKAFKFAYTPELLARCYRWLGYYYIEKKEYRLAFAIYRYSLFFEKHDKAIHEMEYIIQIYQFENNEQFEIPKDDEIKGILIENNIQLMADALVFAGYKAFLNASPKLSTSQLAYYKSILLIMHPNYGMMGLICQIFGDYQSAISHYNEVISIKPKEAGACYNLALCNFHLKKFQEALDYTNKLFELDEQEKNIAVNYSLRGKCYKELQLYNEAVDDFEERLKISYSSEIIQELSSIREQIAKSTEEEDVQLLEKIKAIIEKYSPKIKDFHI